MKHSDSFSGWINGNSKQNSARKITIPNPAYFVKSQEAIGSRASGNRFKIWKLFGQYFQKIKEQERGESTSIWWKRSEATCPRFTILTNMRYSFLQSSSSLYKHSWEYAAPLITSSERRKSVGLETINKDRSKQKTTPETWFFFHRPPSMSNRKRFPTFQQLTFLIFGNEKRKRERKREKNHHLPLHSKKRMSNQQKRKSKA